MDYQKKEGRKEFTKKEEYNNNADDIFKNV